MITKKKWEDFQENGLLWWVNMILHTFGWAICIEKDKETGDVIEAYPARVKFRGFSGECNDAGYTKVTQYLRDNVGKLLDECEPMDCE